MRGGVAVFYEEFDEDALGALAAEVGVKDLLAGAEVEPALGQSDDDVALQGQVLQEDGGVAFVLGAVFVVFADGRELFEPVLEIAMQAGVVFRDEYGGIGVQCGDDDNAVADAALLHGELEILGDVGDLSLLFCLDREVIGVNLHAASYSQKRILPGWRNRGF